MPTAILKSNWREEYKNFWTNLDEQNHYVNDAGFNKLADRLDKEGPLIKIIFTHGDIFEALDNNYWLPNVCFEIINGVKQ